ncbi:uncharacterized protein LOC113127041 isoform X2 [Mastacembelus armatus]|nr:uncharacterized protein LOC113127041 isoform X2 [Mastacembelus armatus]
MEHQTVYCLLCNTPQQSIATHLWRVCMKDQSPEEREQEAYRAVTSQKIFATEGRLWDFTELLQYCADITACINLSHRLQSRGFIVINTPPDCPAVQPTPRFQKADVLILAHKDVLYIQQKIVSGKDVPRTAATTFRQYCEAVLLLDHKLSGLDVTGLSVDDWIARQPVAEGVSIQLSSTARQQTFTLNKQEEGLFECYFQSIRPISLQHRQKDDKGKFFLGDAGVPLSNPASDLRRLRAKYFPRSSEEASAAAAPASASDTQRGQPTPGQASASLETEPASSMQDWDMFCGMFPVTLNGGPPSKEQCIQAGFTQYRPYYHRWRDLQLQQRTQYILRQSVSRTSAAPEAARVRRTLAKETTWTTNRPSVTDVVNAWIPERNKIEEDADLISAITDQKWKGLAVKDFGTEKGKGVIALMPFTKGDVICDYHGVLMSEAEGKQRQQSGYLFFFKGEGGRGMCIDATAFPCLCHPDKNTYGRRLNHSRKKPNVKPQKYTMNFPDGPRDAILFVALRNIKVGEELMWDYGVTRASFGVGLND